MSRAPRAEVAAGLLAAAVHGFFVLLLVFGLSWQMHDPQPVMADLWQSLPELPRPEPSPPPPEPAPLPKPAPAPEPEPRPASEPKAADIALEKKKQKEKLLKQKQAQEAERKRLEEKRREDARRMEREQQKIAKAKGRETLQREEEDMRRRMLDESLAADTSQLRAKAAAAQRASETAKIVARYQDMISAKVRGNTRLPDNLAGNPEVQFEVNVLPTGEITRVRLLKSSGNPAFDQAVQRGIEKSSPLPLPADKEAAAEFRNLVLKHKARE
jgi:colicin import membrane protein